MTEHTTIAEPAGGWVEPWPRAFEISTGLPKDRWALVGGLMVQAHAMALGVATTRVTTDVDATVRLEAGVYSYNEAAAVLAKLGYTVDDDSNLTYRFLRGQERVDLMVADHHRSAWFRP